MLKFFSITCLVLVAKIVKGEKSRKLVLFGIKNLLIMCFMWNGAGARLEILSIREKKDYKFLRSSQIRLNDIFASRNSLNIFRIYFPIVLFKKSHCKTGCLLELKRGLSIAYPIIEEMVFENGRCFPLLYEKGEIWFESFRLFMI